MAATTSTTPLHDSAAPSVISAEPPAGKLDLFELPDPDYANHPAYGRAFPKPGLRLRLKALATLLPWMVFIFLKKLILLERVPALPDYRGHLSGGLLGRVSALPHYLPYILRGWWQNAKRVLAGSADSTPAAHAKLAASFCEIGFAAGTLTGPELEHLHELLARPLAELLAQRARDSERTFEGNTRFFNTGDDKRLFDALNECLRNHGMLAAASAYIGRPVQVTHLLIQINDPGDKYFHGCFKDVGLPDSRTNYMHVDTSYDMVKCAIYLNEVTDDNGPFSYVLGSHRARPQGFEGVVRRANDRAGLSGYSPQARAMFNALPGFLRKKCTFGSDLLDGSPGSEALLASEYRFTSKDGNLGLFANNGIHRGALTKKAERRVLFATIA